MSKEKEKFKITSFQVKPDKWRDAKILATREGLTMTYVIQALLDKWLAGEVKIEKQKKK